MNRIYRDLIYNLAKKCIADARSVSGLLHNGLKGQLRELFIAEMLRPMLPKGYVIGTGNIITAFNEVSKQIDVIVSDEEIVSPLLFQNSVGVFHFEAVLVSVEVKSRLTMAELSSSHHSAKEIHAFRHCVVTKSHIENPITSLFAFDTDLSAGGKSEIDRYIELIGSEEPAIRAICVVGRGSWHWADGTWHNWHFSDEYGEVVAFLIAITSRIQELKQNRAKPNVRDYVQLSHYNDKT